MLGSQLLFDRSHSKPLFYRLGIPAAAMASPEPEEEEPGQHTGATSATLACGHVLHEACVSRCKSGSCRRQEGGSSRCPALKKKKENSKGHGDVRTGPAGARAAWMEWLGEQGLSGNHSESMSESFCLEV